jgi:surface protein
MRKLLLLSAVLIFAGSSDDSSDTNDNNNPSNCDVVYLDSNGVTIKACDDALVGESGVVNGIAYTVVSGSMLNEMIENGDDVTRICTTRIVDMASLFENNNSFNQPIGNWDVSNVTNMNRMFEYSSFNQPIGNWDVSNVTNMFYMFGYNLVFNQPIGDWDVSNVTDMQGMFQGSWSYNGNNNTFTWQMPNPFNQDISNWDVSSVTNMQGMFHSSEFNQDISNWDVSNVTEMSTMFKGSILFNQDLSNWNVDNVIQCVWFSNITPQWTLPQPNFTNCNP